MKWIQWLRRKPLTIQDSDFFQIEYENGIWSSMSTTDRDYMVLIVADEEGPTRVQRQLFQRLLLSLDELVGATECFLKQHSGIADEIGETNLGLYAIELANPAEKEWGEFAIELTDTDADVVLGVRFHNDVPKTWYTDH